MTCALAIVALAALLQWWALDSETTERDTGSPASLTPLADDGPGVPPAPGPQLRMPTGDLDPSPAEGAGDKLTPPPTEPLPYLPPALFPTVTSESIVTAATARVNAQGGQLTEFEVIAVLRAAQWPESAIPDALAVSWCESRWSPYAHNGGNAGLFQMNVTAGATLRGSWFTYWSLPEDGWSDPVVNATAALWTWQRSGWGPWSCSPNS